MVRLRECMKNSARLKELGLPDHYYSRVVAQDVALHSNKNQSKDVHSDKYQSGGSESEYDPLQDDTGEEDLNDDDKAKQCSKAKSRKNGSNQTSSMHPSGFKFRSRKRVFAEQSTPRATRSKKSIAQQDASLTPNGFTQPDDNTLMANVANGITQHVDHNQITNRVRNHVPILTHWKLYKEKPATAFVDLFLGKLQVKLVFAMMKSAVRQQRYRLKQEYFDPFPLHLVTKTSPLKCMSNEQWIQLLESWKSPKKMETCQKNRGNRGNVKFHHTTGSCAYMVHVENLTQMENKLSTTGESEGLKSAAEVVDDGQNTEVELEAAKRANAQLRVQVADLSKKVQESEEARMMDREEMKTTQSEMAAKLDLLLSQVHRS
ncbi:hypothetical protein SORBI_3008G092200 [Sorghum bicolor]|uniref:Uncharacterized protein n=1 Tax=Sorghum bicolor TaxID=4558 RepID=A0A1Z5R6T1_SORBI|nr:hypothetical protein SORBI_3008G092200 [Sorghum bicolor]